jgi:hypothetical protein
VRAFLVVEKERECVVRAAAIGADDSDGSVEPDVWEGDGDVAGGFWRRSAGGRASLAVLTEVGRGLRGGVYAVAWGVGLNLGSGTDLAGAGGRLWDELEVVGERLCVTLECLREGRSW